MHADFVTHKVRINRFQCVLVCSYSQEVMQKMLVNNKCRFLNLMKITVINNA